MGDLGSVPGLGRSPGKRDGYPLQYSGLENSVDCVVSGVTKSRPQLRDFHLGILGPTGLLRTAKNEKEANRERTNEGC